LPTEDVIFTSCRPPVQSSCCCLCPPLSMEAGLCLVWL